MIPFFILFIDTNVSVKLIQLIKMGKIHAYIYTNNIIAMRLKKIFSEKVSKNAYFRIIVYQIPFNPITFNFLLTSKSFWDNIPIKYSNIFLMHNPKVMNLHIALKDKYDKPFFIIPIVKGKVDIEKLIKENPSVVDENLTFGFLLYVNNKFARQTIRQCTKKKILEIRKQFNMQNNEHIERQFITPFYLYFYHQMLDLGYNC